LPTISLTSSVRTSLTSLKSTATQLEKTTERLSTGRKVASAIDNPTNYFAAANYNDRAKSLSGRLDGMSEATQMINAADNGITNIKAFLSQMKGVVNDALSNTASDERRELGKQFNELIVQVKTVAKDSSYGGINLLYGNAANTVQFGEQIGASTLKLQGFNISGATNAMDANGELGSSGVAGTNGDSYALSIDLDGEGIVGLKSFGVPATTTTTVGQPSEIITALNGMIGMASTFGAAYPGYSAGDPTVYNTFHDIIDIATSTDSDGNYLFNPTDPLYPFDYSVSGDYAVYFYQGSWDSDIGNAVADLLTSVRALAQDHLNGIDTTTAAASLGTSIIAVADAYTAYGDSIAGGTGTHEIDWGASTYQTDLSGVIGSIEDMESTLKTQSSKLANNLAVITQRQEFTTGAINILQEGADNLTLADLNEEGANLLSLQTAQSLGVKSLTLASQQSASVLSLIQ